MARSFFSWKSSRRAQAEVDETLNGDANGAPDAAADSASSGAPADAQAVEGAENPGVAAAEEESAVSSTSSEPASPELNTPEAVTQAWRDTLATLAREDAVHAATLVVPLDRAHPGGLAALYADSPTRLSTLVREPTALAETTRRVQALSEFAEQLVASHGGVTLHLSVGSASWGGAHSAKNVPVFSREVLINTDEDGEVTLRLLPGVELSGRLLREIRESGAQVDHDRLVSALSGPHGFSPAAALNVIADLGEGVPSFQLRDDLSLRILSHPAAALYRDLGDDDWLGASPLVAALSGDLEARQALAAPPIVPDPSDRDPWKEVGVGDQSPQTQDVIEALASGGSYLVVPADGADPVQSAVSAAAALAADGKSVLLVSNAPTAAQISAVISDLGLSEIVADFFPGSDADQALANLEAAMRGDTTGGDEPAVEAMRTALRRARAALTSYEEQLHLEFEDWGVTPFDALQVLTELTSDPDGPTTRVRLDADALGALATDGGEHARTLLDEASRRGVFTAEASSSVWDSILLEDADQANQVLAATETLAHEDLPDLRVQMTRVAGQTGLRTATTLDGWGKQLELIERARNLLDVFRPEVFERSPADLVVATATPEWRKAKGINLKRSKRRQRVKQARDLVRPGVHVPDLHDALVQAQECRHQWVAASVDDEPWPVIPEGLEACAETLRETQQQIGLISPYMEPVFGYLGSMSLDELCPILEALAADANGARLVPQRLQVLGELQQLGLGELVDDFRRRHVDGDLLGAELDLSWWASALGMMLAAEPRLGGFDPELLQNLVRQVRVLDKAQIESLPQSIVDRVAARRAPALALYSDQYAELVEMLAAGASMEAMFAQSSLAWALVPIVCAGPATVPALVPRHHRVDVVIAVGMDDLPLAELAPVLARGEDAVLFADSARGATDTWMRDFSGFLTTLTLPAPAMAANGRFAELVAKYKPDASIFPVPTPRPHAAVRHMRVDGSGMPAPTTVAIESSLGEAEAAALALADHLSSRPDQTVAVATLSERHAERIVAALRRKMADSPALSDQVNQRGGPGQLVVEASALPSLRPDHTILSVGFAKTPHGRVIHDFGVLSTDEGVDVLEAVARGSAGDLTVITTLSSHEIDVDRLRHPGERALVDLLALGEGGPTSNLVLEEGEHVPDDLLVDLADRLHALGLPVVANLGEGRHRIPLAVGHPEVPGELLVAVLTDDPAYRAEPSLRVRDRYFPELLERAGWKVYTALSMAVFIDPDAQKDALVELVLDAVDDYYVRVGKPVTPAAAAALAAQGAQLRADSHRPDQTPDETASLAADDADDDTRPADTEANDSEGQQPHLEPTEADEGEQRGEPSGDPADADSSDTPQVDEDEGVAIEQPAEAPVVTRGLPLAAYSDDQLDELAAWLTAKGDDLTEEDLVDGLRETIGLKRRGAQSDAVLRNVAKRALS